MSYPLVLRVLKIWWQQRENTASDDYLCHSIETALDHFGDSVLTCREGEIIRSMLKGHSIKSLARQLDISIDTVKHHRKNIYTKLAISSQSELFDLFLTAIKTYNPAKSSDPLFGFEVSS